MIIEFESKDGTGLLSSFADILGTNIVDGQIVIPSHLGNGYVKGYNLNTSIKMMVRDYELKEDLFIRRKVTDKSIRNVAFSFHHILTKNTQREGALNQLPSVQIATGGMDYEMFFPSSVKISVIVISIDLAYLQTLIGDITENTFLSQLLEKSQPSIFEELISPRLQEVAQEIVEAAVPKILEPFFLKLKAEELVCLTLSELLKRESKSAFHSLNIQDVQKIYEIRTHILDDLSKPPLVADLAKKATMSESKLKRIFKQIFGDSIYSYYQKFRIQSAANLLQQGNMSVSEVGYRLGFTNLSHFSQVFEEQIGVKPKRFSQNKIK